MSYIEPCPGCGKTDRIRMVIRTITYWNRHQKFRIWCERCRWEGPESNDGVTATARWNKRTYGTPQAQETKEQERGVSDVQALENEWLEQVE